MRASTILVIIILLASIFLIASCSEKPECLTNDECTASNSCTSAKCVEGTCVQRVFDGCCGNNKCESMENSCTCEKDCGKCEGLFKYNVSNIYGRNSEVATRYITLYCENEICVKGVLPENINIIKLSNDIMEGNAFKAEILTTINNPYILNQGNKVNVRLLLKERDPDLVGNVTFTRVQILSGSEVLAEKIISKKLNKMGDTWMEELELESSQGSFEELKGIDVRLDYGFILRQRTGTNRETGEPIYGSVENIISSPKNRLAERIMVIKIPE